MAFSVFVHWICSWVSSKRLLFSVRLFLLQLRLAFPIVSHRAFRGTAELHTYISFSAVFIMHKSIPAIPIAPTLPPSSSLGQHLALEKKRQIPGGWGRQITPSNAPRWDQKRRQMPHPWNHPESNTAQDLINHNTHHYFQCCLVVYCASILPLHCSFGLMPLINNTPNCVHDSCFWFTISFNYSFIYLILTCTIHKCLFNMLKNAVKNILSY